MPRTHIMLLVITATALAACGGAPAATAPTAPPALSATALATEDALMTVRGRLRFDGRDADDSATLGCRRLRP